MSERYLDADELHDFSEAVFDSVGVDSQRASTVADGLIRASLRGIDSHGVARLATYTRNFEDGGFNPDPQMAVEPLRGGNAFSVDADGGPGHCAGTLAMETSIERAVESGGIAVATVANSNHFGTAAYYTEKAADADCIGIAMTNVGPDVVPFNGTERYLGTNPISVSIPTDRSFHITLDMATSAVAMGKIDHGTDETIPAHWAVDEAGEPTTDPEAVHALQPLGGPKGYGLAIVVDVLCGLLSGAGPSPSVGALYDDYDQSMDLGHFVGAIDIPTFRDLDRFKAEVGEVVEDLKAIEPRDGAEEVMLPGEIEHRTRRRREREGIPVDDVVWEELVELSEWLDVPLPSEV